MSQFSTTTENTSITNNVKGESPVIEVKDLNGQYLAITKLKFNKNKQPTAGFINIQRKPAIAVYFETSTLSIIFDPKYYGEGDEKKIVPDEQKQYSIVVKANGGSIEVPENTEIFIKYLESIVDKALEFGIENSKEITKKKYDISQKEIFRDAFFNSPLKQGTKPDGTLYTLQFNLKIMKDQDNNPDLVFYKGNDEEPTKINSWPHFQSLCLKNTPCKAVVKPIMSFVNGKIYVTFRLVILKVYSLEKLGKPTTFVFSDTPKQLTTSSLVTSTGKMSITKAEETVVDSEDENTSEVEVDVEDD